jgi:hypothetical protein
MVATGSGGRGRAWQSRSPVGNVETRLRSARWLRSTPQLHGIPAHFDAMPMMNHPVAGAVGHIRNTDLLLLGHKATF